MQCHTEIVGRAVGIEFRPENLQELLTMETVAGFESEQFDDGCGAALPPVGAQHEPLPDMNRKATEELNPQHGHRASSVSPVT